MMPIDDIRKKLTALGWERQRTIALVPIERWTKDRAAIVMTPEIVAMIDAFYMDGCTFGLHRGLYEQETAEDVEPGDQEALAEARAKYLALARRHNKL